MVDHHHGEWHRRGGIHHERNLMINDATITVADIVADNGVVHVIDVVLMPDPTLNYTVLDILGDSPDPGLLMNSPPIQKKCMTSFLAVVR